MRTVMVATDGSSSSLHALSWAAHLGETVRASLVVVTVYRPDRFLPDQWVEDEDTVRERLEQQWCEPARQVGVKFTAGMLKGPVGPTLLRAAKATGADLLVMSARGNGGFPGLALGSVADHVAHHTDLPLAVVPEHCRVEPPHLALLAVDGSAGAQAAAEWYAPVAAVLGSKVLAATVVSPPDPLEVSPHNRRQHLHDRLDGPWTAPLRAAGVPLRTQILEDRHPAGALMSLAADEDAGLVVAGTRQIAGARIVRLGGVTMQLIHHSRVPVIVVPPNAGQPDSPERREA